MTPTASIRSTMRLAGYRLYLCTTSKAISRPRHRAGGVLYPSSAIPFIPQGSRSYFWQKKSPAPQVETPPEPIPTTPATTELPTPLTQEPLSTVDASSAISTTSTIDPQPISDALTEVTSAAAHVVPALQHGDMAALGLVHWTPPGVVPWIIEYTTVSTGLPLWATIVAATVGLRLLMAPLNIMAMRQAALLAPYQPRLAEIRAEIVRAKESGDRSALMTAATEQRDLFSLSGCNPLKQMGAVVTQITFQIGFFLGIRRMCTLPVEQLATGGLLQITDLTLPDPYYILPLVSTALINVQLMMSARDALNAGPVQPSLPHIFNGFRVLSTVSVFVLASLPSGVGLHVITSIIAMLFQTTFFRVGAVRRVLGLPLLTNKPVKLPTIKQSLEYVKQSWRDQARMAQIQAAERERKMRQMMRK